MRAWYYELPHWGPSMADPKRLIRLEPEDWCFVIDGTEFWVPAGYDCDGASVPRAFWWIPGIGAPTQGINAVGAWMHDPAFLTQAIPFSVANEAARQIWIQAGKQSAAASIMKAAVSSPFGRLAYHNSAKDKEELARIRNQLKHRDDKAKFESLWFRDKQFALAA